MKTRRPTVAGMFYPAHPTQLKSLMDSFFRDVDIKETASGIVSPHAGLVCSGPVAAYAYSAISSDFDGTFIVIGPSHKGFPTCVSAIPWETPLGIVNVDTKFLEHLDVPVDEFAHQTPENSLEVQMPFIQYLFPNASVVPVLMGDQSYESAVLLADLIIRAIKETKRDVRIIASSDFSHYISDSLARKQDLSAIKALDNLDIEEFYRVIRENNVSACGYGPIATMVTICRKLFSAEHGHLLKYNTSAECSGDRDRVVGYAAIMVI